MANDIVDIATLRKEFTEKTKTKELKEFASAQQFLIENLMNKNKILEEKNAHLEEILKNTVKKDVVMPISPEEMVCIEQIALLKQKSSGRALELEEAKKFDIFVKNLKLIREESTIVLGSNDYSSAKEDDLVAIAQRSTTTE